MYHPNRHPAQAHTHAHGRWRPHVQREVVSKHVSFPNGVKKVLTQLNAAFQYMFYYVLRNTFYISRASLCRQAKPVLAAFIVSITINFGYICIVCVTETRA